MFKMLKQAPDSTEEDHIVEAIITPNTDENVDRVITYLQQFLERKIPMVPYARLAGSDGMRLSRATFAVMIKFSEFFQDFIDIVGEVDIMWSEFEGDAEREIKMKEELKKQEHFEQISKRWESASKMRQWINEKKKNMMDKVKKEVEAEFMVKKEEEKKKREEEKSKNDEAKPKEEEKKEVPAEEVIETIDTSIKPSEDAPTEPTADS